MSSPPSKVPRYVSVAAAAYALLGGLASFAGWAAGVPRLIDWGGSGISIKANTALGLTVAGAALLAEVLNLPARWFIRASAVFIALVGGLTLLEYATNWDLGIDTLLFDEEPGAAATAAPGRMGPPAATSFVIIGTALWLMTMSGRARSISVALGLAVLAIGTLSLTGYAYGAESMFALPRLTGIATQTASMLVALGIGLIAANPDREPVRSLCDQGVTGILARRLVPLVIAVPFVVGWIRLQGQLAGLYDGAFGSALRTVVEVVLFSALIWWILGAIRHQDAERRRTEGELRDSERRLGQTLDALQHADRRKDEFLATLAHELRNPLAPIRSSAKILLTKGLLDGQRQWAAEVINRQVKHMARLLEDLLDVSRISLNRLELRREWVDLAAVIESAVETSRPLIDAAGHDLVVEPFAEHVYVDGDSVRLAQVFSNLLNNATKYTERGGHIRVSVQSEGAEVAVRVRDDGIGMAPDMLQRLFGMFSQAEPALNRSQGGLGIGLWLSKAVVELHAGRIEAHSAGLGQGSEFVVRLPRVIDIGGAISRPADDPTLLSAS